ncbi:hypothetical protein FRB98_004685 [Tulasnella sp. 332]|nr:hypothetical protein FRB98_004685 [Tulasnella sp. 332]
MRSTLLSTLLTLFLASLSFARITGITAPATVEKGRSFQVTFETLDSIENEVDYFVIIGFHTRIQCNTCIGTPAASFDLFSQGHSTALGSFTETIKAPTTTGVYNVTAAITFTVGAEDSVNLRFLSAPIRVTN